MASHLIITAFYRMMMTKNVIIIIYQSLTFGLLNYL